LTPGRRLNLLRSKSLTDEQIGNYRSIIAAFLNVAETTQPGTAARERIMRDIMSGHQQTYVDQLSSTASKSWSSPSAHDRPSLLCSL